MIAQRSTLRRRTVLGGLGLAAVTLPWLRSIPSANAADYPTRFVVFFSPNEPIDEGYWKPGADFALTEVMQSLVPFKQKLVLIGNMSMHTRDLDKFGGGHVGIGHLLTGEINIPYGTANYEFWAGGISVDQFIASELGVQPLTLAACPGGNNGNSRISYAGANQPVHPIEDPQKAFDSVLGDYTLPPDELAAMRAQRKIVLDSVAGQLGSLQGKLGRDDRQKLEMHLDSVRELEQGLAGGTLSCNPTAPAGGFDYESNADYPITSRRHMDVLAQALACDVTRVASIQLGNTGGGNLTPQWPDFGVDINIDEHNIAHAYNQSATATDIARREAVERFYYEQFAYFLGKLDSIDEGGESLLDHTLVLWTKPIGYNHSGDKLLFILAGGANGALQTGRYLERANEPHNNLLVTCCNLMGLDHVESFGDPSICTGATSV
jgi:uncharacterized protein DUF1552